MVARGQLSCLKARLEEQARLQCEAQPRPHTRLRS